MHQSNKQFGLAHWETCLSTAVQDPTQKIKWANPNPHLPDQDQVQAGGDHSSISWI